MATVLVMKDFTRARPTVQFRLGDRVFTGVTAMGADSMAEIIGMMDAVDENNIPGMLKTIRECATRMLDQPSATEFIRRMASNGPDAVDFVQSQEVISWLVGEFGGRPTEPSESSGVGLPAPTSGQSLTGSTPDVVSTSSPSPGTGS